MSERTFSSEKPLTAKGPAARTAYVVLVVDDELLERVLTATHLRKSGFDVIEAADGDEARRVLGSVDVNVVFLDLAVPGQTNGLALLRWLRERYPAIKAIVTSATETHMAGLDGYGIFLSKPYRMVDLDFCLQKVLATASVPAPQTGGVTTADPRTKTGPGPGKAQPASVRPNGPPAPIEADGRDDEPSMGELRRRLDLSRQLAEREARQRAVDPAAAKAARRAALQAYERARRQRLVVGFTVAMIAALAIAYLVPTVGSPPVPPSPSAAGRPEPASSASMAAATPTPGAPDSPSSSSAPSSPSPTTSIAYTPGVVPSAAPEPAADSQPAPAPLESAAPSLLPPAASLASAGPFPAMGTESAAATDSLQAPLEPAPAQTSLQRDEMREVQTRLRSFGFNPGSVDGVPGAMTESAVMHYQRNRGQPRTGKVDRALLEQLRQDPAPQVAQRAPRPASRPVAGTTTSPGARPSDPFEPVRAAGDRLGRWLESLMH